MQPRLLRRDHGNFPRVFFLDVALVDVVFRLAANQPRKQQYGDDVGNGHERVTNVGDGPHHVAHADRAEERDENVHDVVRQDGALAEQVGGNPVTGARFYGGPSDSLYGKRPLGI